MTTLERMAKAAYERMTSAWPNHNGPRFVWGNESQALRDEWIAAVRAALEVIIDLPENIQETVRRGPPRHRYAMYKTVIQSILEEKP